MVAVSHCKTKTVFDYNWNQVVQAFWNRYPNPSSLHVLTEDTIKREVRDGKLYSRRILTKTNPVPKWGERFYKNVPITIVEDSVLDLQKRTLSTFTRNIGMVKIMKVDEYVEYSEQPDGRTLAVREAYVSSQVFGFSRAIRAFGIERFKSNCNKTTTGFNYVLRNMFPSHEHAAITGTVAAITEGEQEQQQQQQPATEHALTTSATSNTKESLKKHAYSTYAFLKNQTTKILQLFSIKN